MKYKAKIYKVKIYKVKAGDRNGILLSEAEINSNLQIMNVGDMLDLGDTSYRIVEKRFRLEYGQLILVYYVY